MTNKKTTKQQLVASIVLLFMCFSMLIGTTFAWFTDSVSSTNNIIKSGNLDIDLLYSTDFTDWNPVTAETNMFSDVVWEPGHTEVVYLRLKNAGSLALRYRLNMNVSSEIGSVNVYGEEFKLSEHIGYGVVENIDAKYDSREDAIAAVGTEDFVYLNVPYAPEKQELYPANNTPDGSVSEVTLALVVCMSEDVGNEANYAKDAAVPTINLGINLFANQLAYEDDSFGSDYDTAADLVIVNGEIVNIENDVIGNIINNGTANVTDANIAGQLTNNGNATVTGGTLSNGDRIILNDGGNITVENATITQTSGTDYIARSESETDENGVMIFNNVVATSYGGGISIFGGSAIFNSGSITTNSNSQSPRHVFFVSDGANLTINDGNFKFSPNNLTRKGFYVSAVNGSTVEIKGGNFAAASTRGSTTTASANYKTGFYADATSQIIITGGTFGFDPNAWVADGFKAVKAGSTWSVVPVEITDVKGALANGENVVLGSDISIDDKADYGTNGYGKTGLTVNGNTFDGNGKTLSAPESNGTWDSALSTNGGTIKNLTIDSGFRGIFVTNGTNPGKVYLENVVVDGSVYTISCDSGSGKGLEAKNSTFNGWTSYAATIGEVKFVDCSFGEGQGYAFCRPYAPTEFVNCNFEAGFQIDARAAITFENCYLDGVLITDANIGDLVTGNVGNASVK